MSFTFLRWVRQGAAAAVTLSDGTEDAPARATFTASVELIAHHHAAGPQAITMGAPPLQLYGPADVVGLDPRQVVRTVPEAGASAFEPGHFAHVELDRPDLPWMFTPFSARPLDTDPQAALQANGRLLGETLTPWLCLVVVEQAPGVELTPGTPLPVLTVPDLAELPPLAQAHAWAHVALAGAVTPASARRVVEGEPHRTVSRLLCPRHLKPGSRYHACLVPTYRGGRQAGLGQPVDTATAVGPAWTPQETLPLRLPVYFHWEFTTAAGGDFARSSNAYNGDAPCRASVFGRSTWRRPASAWSRCPARPPSSTVRWCQTPCRHAVDRRISRRTSFRCCTSRRP